MTTFLLLLSLILNAAAIFAIILLYLRQNRLVESEKKQGKIISEIEEVFSAYLFELKEEHEKFIDKMKKTKTLKSSIIEKDLRTNAENQQIDSETDLESHTENSTRFGKGISYQAARKAYQQNSEPKVSIVDPELESVLTDQETADLTEQDNKQVQYLNITDQISQLKNQGLSIEEIARNLNKGKTEIELLLKFRQNT